MQTRGTGMRQVALMQFGPDEIDAMERLNTVWVQTMDLRHDNVLLYPIDIVVDDIRELYPKKYINADDFIEYEAENGGHWLISKSLRADDVDAFFHLYLHLDETAA